MAAAPSAPFDAGPLSWVKTEIDHSLNEARQHLDKVAAVPTDGKSVKFVQTHLHQISGALAMVGLGTATRFNEEIEKTVAVLQDPSTDTALLVTTSKRGMSALASYLDSLIAGSANRPMVLAASYVQLCRARGATDASESDLFYPDLNVALPPPEDTVVIPTREMLQQSLQQRRASLQAGLLKLLRDKDFVGGLRMMKEAVLGVEALQLHSAARPFWFAIGAFLDVVAQSPADQRSVAVALFGKIDQQIKLLQEGNQKVPERLFRDILLVIGRSKAQGDRIREVRQLFNLDDLLATGDQGRGEAAEESLKEVVRTLRELTAAQKDCWLKFTSGNRQAIDLYLKQSEVLVKASTRQSNADLTMVLKAMASVGTHLRSANIPASETIALEVATALLFMETSLENYFRLTPEFSGQARTVSGRISAAMTGAALPALDPAAAGLMDEMSKRAQERLLMFQVGQEVLVNLQSIEVVLDSYFRDPLKAGELPKLAPLFSQVQGALTMLDLNEAGALSQMLARRVADYASGARKGDGDDAESVAEGVSALGLFIGAVQQGQSNSREALLPALIRFGLAAKPVEPKAVRKSSVSAADIQDQKQKAHELYEEWKQKPEATATRDQLKKAVEEIRRDSELVSDRKTAQESAEALSILEFARDPNKTGLHAALQIIAPAPPVTPVEPPSPQAVHLLDKESAEVDAELLEIFLEEAVEVIGTVTENLEIAREAPQDKEALTTIRRGFHTLKGSGRMVGLTDLGEVAWQVEQVMNKWLKEDKSSSGDLQRFIAIACDHFSAWVDALKDAGHTAIDASELVRLADALKNDKVPDFGDAPVPAEEPAVAAIADETLQGETSAVEHAAATIDADGSCITIGDVSVDESLFDIYLEEARVHVGTMHRECAFLEDSPKAPVAHEFLRAAHTLTGSSNTTGFASVSRLAHALEEWIKTTIEFPAEISAQQLSVTRDAVNALQHMVAQLESRDAPLPRDDVAAELDILRQKRMAAQRVGEDSVVRTGRFYGLDSEQGEAETSETAASDERAPDAATPFDMTFDEPPREETPAATQVDSEAFDFLTANVPEVPLADQPPPIPAEEPVAKAADPDFSFLDAPSAELLPQAPLAQPSDEEAAFFDEVPAESEGQAAEAQLPPEPEAAAEQPALDTAPPEPPAIVEPAAPESEPEPAEADSEPEPFVAPPATEELVTSAAAPRPTDVTEIAAAFAPAPGAAPFESGKEKRRIQDDIDADLLPIFLEEAKEVVPQVGGCLRTWRANPTDHAPVVELARHLHTLKGSARMAGLMRLGELSHVIETQIIEMDADSAPTAARFDRVDDYWDRFTGSIDRLEAGEELLPAIEIPVSDIFDHQKDKRGAIAVMAAAAAAVRDEVQLEGRERQALLRVNADMIDRFVNEAGELSITRSRIDGEMLQFKRALVELTDNVSRMRSQLREIEIQSEMAMASRIKERDEHSEAFDPLEFDRFSRMQEVTRFLAESLHDVITLQQGLQKNLDEADAALTHQGRLNRDLQQGLMGVRLVPLANLQDRLYRVVRQTAKEVGKKANLEFRGARVELDRSVLEKITAPFEHLLRNSVAHGLEMPDKRTLAGKPEIGEITIDASQVGNEIVLVVRDDGGGLNYPRIRQRAIEVGLLDASVDAPEEQLAQFIFMAGFSTAVQVTEIAGRGVGMDVVKNEIVSLGGRIELASVAGKGITFTITLPLTLAVTQAVMVRVGESLYAIPSVMVEQVQEYKGKKYDAMREMKEIDWKGNRYPFRSLEALLGKHPAPSVLRRAFSILAKRGTQRAAVQVDEIVGNREIVVKQIGPQLARLPGISGATVLGNGQVVLILNPVQLVFRETAAIAVETERGMASGHEPTVLEVAPTLESSLAGPAAPVAVAAPVKAAPLVMVVDDSLTVRKITSRMLTREGFEVATAKDGVDGLKQLQDLQPDIILLDIEMPRMDGFEFARNMRADAKTRDIPIIMITSRTADKHRNRAKELGVNEYMGKPYQEDQLMALIRNYTGAAPREFSDE